MTDIPEDPKFDRPPSPVTELAAGPAFESRVRTIIREHAGTHSQDTSPSSIGTFHDTIESTDGGRWRDATELVNVGTAPPLLSKDESFRLFDIFVSWMGNHQHFLDPRSFADSIDLLYQSEGTRQTRMQTMWFNQYLLVMAVGMLIGCPNENSDNPPGNTYFAEAMRRLPPIHELGSHGTIAVEILCLASLYLQWCDRRHDAYLYVRLPPLSSKDAFLMMVLDRLSCSFGSGLGLCSSFRRATRCLLGKMPSHASMVDSLRPRQTFVSSIRASYGSRGTADPSRFAQVSQRL